MKILLIDENKVVNYAGGIEKVLCDFANEFTKRGHEVSLICMDEDKGGPFFHLDDRVNFINLAVKTAYYGNFFNYRWLFKKLQREVSKLWHDKYDYKSEYFFQGFRQRLDIWLEKICPDVVVVIGPESAVLAQGCPHLENIAVVSMCHIVPKLEHFSPKHIEAWQKCKTVQVLQPDFVAQMQALGIENVTVIPNGVKQESELVVRKKSKEETKKMILVARIEPVQKRQHLAIQAFAQIAGKHPDWQFEMYGTIGNKKYYNRLQRLITEEKLESQVRLIGPVKDLRKVYQQSDILVSASEYESFGLSVVEAMSAGLPVIAFRECYANDYIVVDGHTGLLCDNSVEDLAKSMEILMSNYDLRNQYGQSAHEYAKKFTPEKVWDQWESLLKKCV